MAATIRSAESMSPGRHYSFTAFAYYEERFPFAWMLRRTSRALRRATRAHAALAMAGGVAGGAGLAASLARGEWPPDWLWTPWLALALAHLFLAVPILSARVALGAVDRARGGGQSDGHHLNLLAIPDLPRPLYFHVCRAGLAPLASEKLAKLPLSVAACWILIPALFGSFASALAGQAGPSGAAIPFEALFSAAIAVGTLASASLLLSRRAIGMVVGACSGLGDASGRALAPLVPLDAEAALAKRDDLDEAWDRRPSLNVFWLFGDALRRAAIAALALALYPLAIASALALAAAIAAIVAYPFAGGGWADATMAIGLCAGLGVFVPLGLACSTALLTRAWRMMSPEPSAPTG